MARNNNSTGKVSGKIRFIMLEADIEDGNLSEIAQAISAAVRPTTIVQRVIEAQVNTGIDKRTDGIPLLSSSQSILEEAGSEHESEIVVNAQKPRRPASKAKPFKGQPDDTIEWDGNGIPFAAYMKQKGAEETSKRYLAIAAWFKLHGGRESIDGNVFWNAYRMLGMNPLSDITQPCRHAVHSGYMSQPSRSQFAITKIGLDVVDKMGIDRPTSEL